MTASDLDTETPNPPDLKERLSEAWPTQRLAKLGPLQEQLLTSILMVEKHELTVPVLRGMLKQEEDYFPEEVIRSSESLKPLLMVSSKAGG